jgi:cell division protein FtsL
MFNIFLILVFLASGGTLVWVEHGNRALLQNLEALRVQEQDLLRKKQSLLLERSTFASNARIEQLGRQQGLFFPKESDLRRLNLTLDQDKASSADKN